MFIERENEQSTTSLVGTTVDTDGGWIINHKQTVTSWDERMRVDEVDAQIVRVQDSIKEQQALVDTLTELKTTADKAIAIATPPTPLQIVN